MSAVQQIQNPLAALGGQVVNSPTQGAMVDVEQQRAMMEVQAAVAMAKKFPRDPFQAMDRILNDCRRPTLAEKAIYAYSKGGTEITGPSIRLAEAIAQSWGNIQFGIRELDQRPGASILAGTSTVEAYAWDCETNTRQVKVFQVSHTRYTKKGSYKLEDPREIYEHVANQGARRLRACILGIIPGDVIEAAVNQCNETMKTNVDVTPDSIKKMLEKFATLNVTKEMIEKRIQRRIESILPAQVVSLRNIYNSMSDGMSFASDWFEVVPAIAEEKAVEATTASSKTDSIKSQLKADVKPPEEPQV